MQLRQIFQQRKLFRQRSWAVTYRYILALDNRTLIGKVLGRDISEARQRFTEIHPDKSIVDIFCTR